MPPRAARARVRPAAGADALTAAVLSAELEVEAVARAEDIAAGLIPPWARRSLHPWELAARVNFAGIDDDVERAVGALTVALADQRAAFLVLLAADLRRAGAGGSRAVLERLLGLEVAGLNSIDGFEVLLATSARDLAAALEAHARRAAARVANEAALQGASLSPVELPAATRARLDLLGARMATTPHLEALRAAKEAAAVLPIDDMAPGAVVDAAAGAVEGMADSPLEAEARRGVSSADGMGRLAQADAGPQPTTIYASELLDSATCGPCSLVDGRTYATVAEARRDYPFGIYRLCEGGTRCRGACVFVWSSEATPTT